MSTTEHIDVVIDRVFDAPRELVYNAFIDPDQLAAWYGPAGWSVPRDSVSVTPQVGGEYRLTMVSDDDATRSSGVDSTFTEVVPNELLVCTERVGAEMGGG